MEPLTVLDQHAVILVSREGGVAYMPALNGERRMAAAQMSEARRQGVCQLINQVLGVAQTGTAGCGDQRYFRLTINSGEHCRDLQLIIPEADAPKELVRLWDDAERE